MHRIGENFRFFDLQLFRGTRQCGSAADRAITGAGLVHGPLEVLPTAKKGLPLFFDGWQYAAREIGAEINSTGRVRLSPPTVKGLSRPEVGGS